MALNSLESSHWVKVADGTLASCRNMNDVMRHRHQAYMLKNKKLTLEQNILTLKLDVQFVQCVKNGDSFKFMIKNPYERFQFQNYDLSESLRDIEVDTEWVKVIIYRDGIYKLLYKDVLTHNLNLQTQISLEDLLTEKELERLEQGKAVNVSFDFMLNRKVFSRAIMISNEAHPSVIRYGSFRQHLTLVKRNGKTVIKSFR